MLAFQVLNVLPSLENLNLRGNPLCSELTYEDEVNTLKFTGSYVIVCFIHNEWNIIKFTQNYGKYQMNLIFSKILIMILSILVEDYQNGLLNRKVWQSLSLNNVS